ncbi:hepatocyte growth factor-regulated tyrosine kinase substrate-like [Amphiura filiformis]|uniref:hepatocyte growth factor-regulated tyrosine kinase substrate-like n=1 Tax=Amphiura filiformis TaxID=82378 RepID=UPI003B22518D
MFTGSSRAGFERQLERATSSLLLEPDWDATLQLCDLIRSKEVTPKYAITTMRKKLFDKNPRVVLYALQVLESCVKNCGHGLHEEIATYRFMEDMKDLIKSSNEAVKNKALELLQAWSHAFRHETALKIIVDTFNTAKVEGHSFPPLREADAMFVAERAPDWVDGERCHTCRVEFSVVQRKHHCRHCGQIFCNKCTTKQVPIPKFGIEKAVRVCEPCYDKLTSKTPGGTPGPAGTKESDLPAEYLNSPLAQQSQLPPQKSEIEIQEEEELQLAMALSLDEAENKHLLKKDGSSSAVTSSSAPASSTYSNTSASSAPAIDSDLDPELARYLNRPYWEQRQEETKTAVATAPSAPMGAPDPTPASAPPSQQVAAQPIYAQSANRVQVQEQLQLHNGEVNDDEEFLRAVTANIDVFLNRMRSNESRGRSIASDTTVQGLFQTLNNMHPQLLKLLHGREERRAQMETLQDKLAQIRDAREALDALREDHREKLRREAEEAERVRQIQLAQKLEVMRQKKQEYLQHQQQLALQRLQEQEREMQIRLEQQKHEQQMRQVQYTASLYGQQMMGMQPPPQGGMPLPPGAGQMLPGQYSQQPQTFSPPNSMQGSPQHAYNSPQNYPSGAPPPGQMDQPSSMGAPPGPGGYQQQTAQQYQAPPGGVPQGSYGGPGQYQGAGGYNSLTSMEYQAQQANNNPYNMQAMSNTLPNTQPQGAPHNQQGPPQQQYMPPQQGGMYPQGGDMQYPGNATPQQQPPPQQLPPQQPPPQQPPPQQHPPPQDEGTLISFD